jgi:hypothetical protein
MILCDVFLYPNCLTQSVLPKVIITNMHVFVENCFQHANCMLHLVQKCVCVVHVSTQMQTHDIIHETHVTDDMKHMHQVQAASMQLGKCCQGGNYWRLQCVEEIAMIAVGQSA